ncbi:MAG: (Fe-S)-binding protein [Lachnospiraceae bacterium]
MQNDTESKLLRTAEHSVRQCERCGTCITVCPLYNNVKDVEAVGPRGKNMLCRALAQGGLKSTTEVLNAVNFCLLCGTCVENCPSKIKTDRAMMDIREYLASQRGGPGIKYSVLGGVMKRRSLVKLGAGALSIVRKLGLHNVVPYGMAPKAYKRSHLLESFAGPNIHGSKIETVHIPVATTSKVAYFRGCGMEMMFPEAAADTRKILATISSPIIKENVCCGLPHLAHGLRNDFIELAKSNIAIYEEVEIVVTDCASCSSTLKHIADYFIEDPEWGPRAAAFSQKIMDISEYLVKVGYSPQKKIDATLTYHDPCHSVRGQGIKNQPRQLLKKAGNFVEMKEADMCCGGAGSFHMDYPKAAAEVLKRKQENIEKTKADIVVTSCPVCLVQLNKAAKASGDKFKAVHISQII